MYVSTLDLVVVYSHYNLRNLGYMVSNNETTTKRLIRKKKEEVVT